MNAKKLPLSLNLAITLKAIEQAFRKNLSDLQIELPEEAFGILMIAYFHQGVIQQDIAEMAKKDKSAVLRQIDLLENKGLVQRKADEHDRRKNLITVTEKGKAITQTIVNKEHELFHLLLQGVNEQDIETFSKVLAILKNNAGKI
ncbi:MarR family winged helix-turn-helix transcriptional regulator [Candidatus Symbiothrix dinenymphae]|uniref:MarR family winged helix-turn-helix transcriptional regulator n=1 Tax=Candidatus Symbiothrix dinenymphae TaxID=467085 RepID=UPI0006C241AA|nr:MarR family transcriptional regulator [Candidatus Symbiothrix dinenymphae]GAP72908.1 transcriptional regulator, MarR family [Candidatus Symbiothrix dinenymphae]